MGQKNESLSLALVEEQRKLIRPILVKHNGREVKTIGDAFFVEFLSALEAVRCAYEIQRTVHESNFSLPKERHFTCVWGSILVMSSRLVAISQVTR